MHKKVSRVQVPYGIVHDNKKEIKLDFTSNYKTEVLFLQSPYLAHLDDPI